MQPGGETDADTRRLQAGERPERNLQSPETPSLCTTYTKPQRPAAAGRPRHKNAAGLKAALNLTLESENGGSRAPAGQLADVTQEVDGRWTAAALAEGLRDEASHPKTEAAFTSRTRKTADRVSFRPERGTTRTQDRRQGRTA